MKILVTAVGKRIQLIDYLKKSFEVIGVDIDSKAPASFFVDQFFRVPRYTESDYVDELIKICRQEGVAAIIPLMEREFHVLAEARERFNEIGTQLILSNIEVIRICNDKIKTEAFFSQHHIPHSKCYNNTNIKELEYPVMIKPSDGMGSQNVFKVNNEEELLFFSKYIPNHIIEAYIEGTEYTVDVLTDFDGQPIYIIPRVRLEVRGGEVSKSRIDLDQNIIEATKKLIRALNSKKEDGIGVMGPLTIQCFKKADESISFLEVNPRFGGGVPLSIEAGADYGGALYAMLNGEVCSVNQIIKPLTMLRYDEAVFLEE